jgi:hypothetical protein
MFEVAQSHQVQEAYDAAHAARGAAFVGMFSGLFRYVFRSAAPVEKSAGAYGAVPLT